MNNSTTAARKRTTTEVRRMQENIKAWPESLAGRRPTEISTRTLEAMSRPSLVAMYEVAVDLVRANKHDGLPYGDLECDAAWIDHVLTNKIIAASN